MQIFQVSGHPRHVRHEELKTFLLRLPHTSFDELV